MVTRQVRPGRSAGTAIIILVALVVVAVVGTAGASARPRPGARRRAVATQAPPTVTIDQAASQLDPAHGDTIYFDVVFSRAVVGFDGSDVGLTGDAQAHTAIVTAVDGSHYTVAVMGMQPQLGSVAVIATIPAGAAVAVDDGQLTAASTSTDNIVRWYGRYGPDAYVNQADGPDPSSESSIVFSISFSRSIQGFVGGLDLTGPAAVGTTQTVTQPALYIPYYLVTVKGMTHSGTMTATLPAGAVRGLTDGQPSLASTSTDNVVTWIAPEATTTTTTTEETTTTTTVDPSTTTTTLADTTTTTGGSGVLGVQAVTTTTDPATDGESLPVTGLDPTSTIALGVALTAMGCLLLTLSRRRRAEAVSSVTISAFRR